MVGLKRRSIRHLLGLGPSKAELAAQARSEERSFLLKVLADERAAAKDTAKQHHEVMVKVLEGISANSNSFAQWMKMIGSAGENRVRIMTDELEAVQERDRATSKATDQAKNLRDMFVPLRATPEPVAIPMSNVEADHAALLQDLFS